MDSLRKHLKCVWIQILLNDIQMRLLIWVS